MAVHGKTGEPSFEGTRLARLDELDDYEIADGDPDIRGWDVKNMAGVVVGEVENLIADPATLKVRYMEVEVDSDFIDLGEDNHVLIPIEVARLDNDDDVVHIRKLPMAGLAGVPRVGREPLTAERDRELCEYYAIVPEQSGEQHKEFFGPRRTG